MARAAWCRGGTPPLAKKRDKKKSRSSSKSGALSGMRMGFKGLVGQGSKTPKKESTLSKVVTWTLLAAAIAFLAYRLLTR
jgi:hypothetical protein